MVLLHIRIRLLQWALQEELLKVLVWSYLWIIKKSEVVILIHLKIFLLGASYSWQDDHSSLLSLKLFHAANFNPSTKPSLFNHLLNLLHLTKNEKKVIGQTWSNRIKFFFFNLFFGWNRVDTRETPFVTYLKCRLIIDLLVSCTEKLCQPSQASSVSAACSSHCRQAVTSDSAE